MECKCYAPVTRHDVKNIMGDKVFNSYTKFLIETQISENPNLKHCINPRCQKILTTKSICLCLAAECECGARICWCCGEEAHDPVTCETKDKWLSITQEDSLSERWEKQNSKRCPNCKAAIEKNGGCNHMTCYKCHYEFCWICGKKWSSHGYYDCISYPSAPSDFEKNSLNFNRVTHYYDRYKNHFKSKANEDNKRSFCWMRLYQMITTNKENPANETDAFAILKKLFILMNKARTVLAWSFVYAYYMKPFSHELELFEYVQEKVEKFVNDLSDIIENNPGISYSDLNTAMVRVEKNLVSLLKHVSKI
ncbi:IBR domain containing protein [Trichomonas vaginalis G3]|uniref:RBR-type E3 ubiquitin transferase n=1 Tax=Trichomonas vaginalis (strain ATCC PRA-98 / G3) TaxID=412133 RepID=A2E3Y5_TRIV3|nr:protein polyubiquitination [Trichomonas vaginalis G3]EAY12640.1 IBR domain containing protein [Trichomonas vaginalis G3]KAI5547000.1 protein polyubiquitination [Trichomonas vaginalis G3]|eukprot:XP_001324863.1 IBR domain containing protein [Trichomonas vaginalis G3]